MEEDGEEKPVELSFFEHFSVVILASILMPELLARALRLMRERMRYEWTGWSN